MDDLRKIGEKILPAQANIAGGANVSELAEAISKDPDLAELFAGGGDVEQYLQNYEQMLTQGLEPQLDVVDAEGGVLVRPDPGFVIKTRDLQSGSKVFLNVVANKHVERPHMKSIEELQGEQGCRVPMSVGNPVEDFDKKGEPCVSFDLVANPHIVEECVKEPAFKESVISICMAAVSQKHKVELDQRYKLPKMLYKGARVQLQRIRVSKQTQIQEVGSADPPLPGESAKRRGEGAQVVAKGALDGPSPPDFCMFFSRPEAGEIDGFAHDWPSLPPESCEEAAKIDHLSVLDLPRYKVNDFQDKVRGSMMNKTQREGCQSLKAADHPLEVQTVEMIKGRSCVSQVRMNALDVHTPSLKQFSVEISDECLRVTFPLLPRSRRAAYGPLVLWWPHPVCSAEASAVWATETDTLVVTVPTETPAQSGEFDPAFLDAVF